MAILTTRILRGKRFTLYAMERSTPPGVPDGYHYFIAEERNGIEYYFLIDTGASSTIIDSLFADRNIVGQTELTSNVPLGVTTLIVTGNTLNAAIIECEVLSVHKKFFCADLSFFSQNAGIAIGGIIGADLMDLLNTKIDLRNRTILFRDAT